MASPLDQFNKNDQKQNFIDYSGSKQNEDELSEYCQNENDSHKSNSRKKNKRNFTTMVADTVLPHADDGSSKFVQEKLNSSSNPDKTGSNSKQDVVTDQSKQCDRFSISTHATSNAEPSRDSMTPLDSISSLCNSN